MIPSVYLFLMLIMSISTDAESTAADTKTQPIKKANAKGVSLAIFPKTIRRDDGSEIVRFSTVLEGRYEKDGDWHSTSSFSEDQLSVIEDFAREARQFIREQRSKKQAER